MTPRRNFGGLGVATLCVGAALASCTVPPPSDVDAAQTDGGTPGVPGTAELLPAATETPGLVIDSFVLRIDSIRFIGDRGPAFDPEIDGVGLVALGATEVEIPMGDVPPALYSTVLLALAATPEEVGAPVLEVRLPLTNGDTLDIATTAPMTLTARCEHGAVVNTTGAVSIGIDFSPGEAFASVLAHVLPAPDASGVILVNEATAPDAIASFRAELMEHIHAECGPDTL